MSLGLFISLSACSKVRCAVYNRLDHVQDPLLFLNPDSRRPERSLARSPSNYSFATGMAGEDSLGFAIKSSRRGIRAVSDDSDLYRDSTKCPLTC
jgi:hypothetical protein